MKIYKIIDALHQNLGCSFKEFEGGANLPISYSDRLREEINFLLYGCGLFDLKACWLIALKGIDAGSFLQGMVTSDVLQLELGQIQSGLICNNKGKIIHHLEIFRSETDEWIVICDPGEGQAVGTILDNFHIREELGLRLLNSAEMLRIDLIGPDAEKNVQKMGYVRDKIRWKYDGAPMLTAKFDLGNLTRLINIVHVSVLKKFIMHILQNEKADLVGLEAIDEIRCLEGIPRSGVDYGTDNFPQEASLSDHISFKKGCYIGQEPHARMYHRGHPNWLSVWLRVPEKYKVTSKAKLFQTGKEIGRITSLGSISIDRVFRGIAMIRHEASKKKDLLSLSVDEQPEIAHEPLPSIIF